MKRKRFGIAAMRFALVFSILLSVAVSRARADIPIASDSYATGTDPTMGQYAAGTALSGQPGTLSNLGFTDGGYIHGFGTSNFVASTTGLINAADGASASTGSVGWVGAPLDNGTRSVARNLSAFNEGTTGTYWISELMSNTGNQTTTSGWVLSGFGNATFPSLGTTSGNLFGLYFGFANDSGAANEADLVMRFRSAAGGATSTDQILVNGANNATAGNTYLVVAEVNVNSSNPLDHVNYWVNPTDLSSQAALTSTALASGSLDTLAFQGAATGTGDFTRLNYAAFNWDGDATFDEARLGTTLASIAPSSVPEPSSMILLGAGSIAALAVRSRRRARVQS
jgi:PEP-CTERM motif